MYDGTSFLCAWVILRRRYFEEERREETFLLRGLARGGQEASDEAKGVEAKGDEDAAGRRQDC